MNDNLVLFLVIIEGDNFANRAKQISFAFFN